MSQSAVSKCCHRSDYKKYLPGQVITINLKIGQNCRLFLDIFSSAIMNDLTMTFTSTLKWMPYVLISGETGSEWRTILGHPQLIECMGICVLSLAHGSEQRGSVVICILHKELSGFFSFKFSKGTCPWIAFAWIFFGI